MKKYFPALLFCCLACTFAAAQSLVELPPANAYLQDTRQTTRLGESLDSLFSGIRRGNISGEFITTDSGLNRSVFMDYRDFFKPDKPVQLQLLNYYPIDEGRYWLEVGCTASGAPYPTALLTLVASDNGTHFRFGLPVGYLTRNWKKRKVGEVTYYFESDIDLPTAKAFNSKNRLIARKLGLPPESLDFYMTDNYQQVLHLLGYAFYLPSAGKTRGGYGVDCHTIFAINHNEDFSHDLIHYYVARIRKNSRNSAAEEGLAYYWGNAYYTDSAGRMIGMDAMVSALKTYLAVHPDADFLTLFRENKLPFPGLAKEVAVKSMIAALFCREIERTKGMDGIRQLVNCGKGDENYFHSLNELTGIDTVNFNDRVKRLLVH